jgi:uncharacterized protein (DUF697 family)
MDSNEVLAGVRALVCVAKADGVVKPEERTAVETVLEAASIDGAPTVDALFEERIDFDTQVGLVKSPEARKQVYAAACALTQIDRDASKPELELLSRMRASFGMEEKAGAFDRFREGWRQDWNPGNVERVDDPLRRSEQVDAAVRRAAVRAAVYAALPIPGVSDFMVAFAEIRMLRLIGRMYGHSGDNQYWKAFAGNVAGSALARIAAVNVVKLLPGWGNVTAASWTFATTWALGRATKTYFENGAEGDPAALRDVFKAARKEGEKLARASKEEIEKELDAVKRERDALEAELVEGKIGEKEYARRLAQLDAGS